MHIGTARAEPGELDRGSLAVADLPTGIEERVPVIVANGADDGPTLWVHGGIHGDEATGIAVAQDAVDESLVEELRGTVVVIPNVNPAGLRRNARESYYHEDDPNRYFPTDGDGGRPPRLQEQIDAALFDLIDEHADALVDLHTAGVNSMPFIIRNRVRYGDQRTEAEARELSDEIDRLAEAFGLPLVTTYPPEEKGDVGLDRSTTSTVMDRVGIPAFTPELGSHSVVEEQHRKAGVIGVRNVMRALDMLDGDPVENDAAPEPPVDYRVRRASGPRTDRPGFVRFHLEAGDVFEEGDPIADIVTPAGAHETTVTAEHDGYVVGRREGIGVYDNDRLASLAVRDEDDLVISDDD